MFRSPPSSPSPGSSTDGPEEAGFPRLWYARRDAVARFLLRYSNNQVLLSHGDFSVGRSQECGLPLDDEKVSRRHALFHVTADELTIEDLQSRNGVFVNGERVTARRRLHHGDVILIGRQEIHVIEEGERQRRADMPTVSSPEESDEIKRELAGSGGVEALDRLSRREQEVLRLLALGHTHKEIAQQLGVSVKTVETYRARVADKLELRSRADLVRYALSAGLLE